MNNEFMKNIDDTILINEFLFNSLKNNQLKLKLLLKTLKGGLKKDGI